MKSLIIAATIFAAAAPAMAQTSVNINVGQPGFYGQLNIGGFPPPPVYYTQPVIVERQIRYVDAPVYLRVPEGHRKHWNKHCYRYNACGRRVFFVQDGWYNNTYVPRYREQHFSREDREDHGDWRSHDRRERHERDDREDDRGHGNGNHNGHGNGHGKHGD